MESVHDRYDGTKRAHKLPGLSASATGGSAGVAGLSAGTPPEAGLAAIASPICFSQL
jgi:hypothetical protein